MDTILNLIPGRRAAASAEPSEEAIRRTHDNLRCVCCLPVLPLRAPSAVDYLFIWLHGQAGWTPCSSVRLSWISRTS